MIKITRETRKAPKQRPPPEDIALSYIPSQSEEEAGAYMAARLRQAGIDHVEGAAEPHETKVDTGCAHDLNLYLGQDVVDDLLVHCAEMAADRLEALGFLVGDICQWNGQQFSVVYDVVTGQLDATATSVRFRQDAFEDMFDELDELGYDYVLIGWYHSHPGYTSFMSHIDLDTQIRMFNQPFHVALVADPVALELKAFRWMDGECVEIPYAVVEQG